MDPIYVTGHRNPDTDSIVAAMAYAALRSALGDREYRPACLGRVSDETQLVLDRFGFEAPKRITSMYTQVQDLDYDTPPVLDANVTVAQAWKVFQAQTNISALPVANEDGTLYGMLSKDYIATYNMDLIAGAELADVPLFNVLSVLEGKVLNDAGDEVDTISGKVTIALPQSRESLLWSRKDSIVFCGHQPDMIRRALEMNVTALVLCQTELDEELRSLPTTTCIISTPYAAYRATRMIFQSTPIGRICRKDNLVCFHLEDRVDDVKETVLKHRESSYPILDGEEKIVGLLSRYHLLRPRRKRVVLVDHNERAQAVPGLDQAEILEIIDHHRLGTVETMSPVFFRNQPLGCTATIIYQMYQENHMEIDKTTAGLLCSAIISDTLLFRSPTCTPIDKAAGLALAQIAGLDIEKYAIDMFSAGSNLKGKSDGDIFYQDFKRFTVGNSVFGIGQITSLNAVELKDLRTRMSAYTEKEREQHEIDMMFFMLTNILTESTDLICTGQGAEQLITTAFHVRDEDVENVSAQTGIVKLPGVVSRKKQLAPQIMMALQ